MTSKIVIGGNTSHMKKSGHTGYNKAINKNINEGDVAGNDRLPTVSN